MKEIIIYECEACGKRFDTKEECEACEASHGAFVKANQMLRDGKTLEEINEECKIWDEVPEEIKDLTILKAYVRYGKDRSGAGRIIVSIGEDGRVQTAKVKKEIKGTNSTSIKNFAETYRYNDEESEYMAYLYSKYGKDLFN